MVTGRPAVTTDEQRPRTPAEAWAALEAGNRRFVTGQPQHPNQNASRRDQLANGQAPFATFFGCADSRVASEVIFDQGLGDLFVIRTAGHVVDSSVLGSLEFATELLSVPLIVVLGHDSCGAVKAGMQHDRDGSMPRGYIRDIVERVTPSVIAAKMRGETSSYEVEAEHVRQTMRLIMDRSLAISDAVTAGNLALIGLTYKLRDGQSQMVAAIGPIG